MDPMGIDGRREGQYDGYPFVPQHTERPYFARCVRNAIVEKVLDGAQSVYRFGDGRRFKFPIPDGDKLLSHVVHADVIAVQGRRKSIQVTVRFPCAVPHATWATDPFEATIRIEYVREEWDMPKPYGHEGKQQHDGGIDPSQFHDDDGWHGFRNEILEHEGSDTVENGGGILRRIGQNRLAIGIVLMASSALGWAASRYVDVPKGVQSARQQLLKLYDWIDGTQRPIILPPRR